MSKELFVELGAWPMQLQGWLYFPNMISETDPIFLDRILGLVCFEQFHRHSSHRLAAALRQRLSTSTFAAKEFAIDPISRLRCPRFNIARPGSPMRAGHN